MHKTVTVLLSLAVIVFACNTPAGAQSDIVLEPYRGLTLGAVPAPSTQKFDVSVVPPKDGLARLRKAFDILMDRSSYSAKAVQNLIDAGQVFLIYDPSYPNRKQSLNTLRVAFFVPQYAGPVGQTSTQKNFIAIVSRHGIKWPTDELAMVIAHELVGHGVQHLRGRLKTMRLLDLECEAYLYQEKATQDLQIDKHGKIIVQTRRQMEAKFCSEFRRFQAKQFPKLYAGWNTLNPDVPKLLDNFEVYLQHLRKTGVTAKALKNQKSGRQAGLARIERDGSPKEQFSAGRKLITGIGMAKDIRRGVQLVARAAQAGHADAQIMMGDLYRDGALLKKNRKQAKRWYLQAAKQRHPDARTRLQGLKNRAQ